MHLQQTSGKARDGVSCTGESRILQAQLTFTADVVPFAEPQLKDPLTTSAASPTTSGQAPAATVVSISSHLPPPPLPPPNPH